jgi:hypothetical protein
MAARTIKKPGTHDTCKGFLRLEGGGTLICRRSPGHTASTDPKRALHYTPDDGGVLFDDNKIVEEDA